MCYGKNESLLFLLTFTVRFILQKHSFFSSGISIVQAVLFLEFSLCVTAISSMMAVYYNVCENVN